MPRQGPRGQRQYDAGERAGVGGGDGEGESGEAFGEVEMEMDGWIGLAWRGAGSNLSSWTDRAVDILSFSY